jgi:hypothetical protein
MPRKPKLKPGDIVRVVGERGTAKIHSILTSMHGVLLEKRIGDFRSWNIDELRLVNFLMNVTRRKTFATWRDLE